MSNSPWTKIEDEPPPEGESVLLFLAKDRNSCRFAIRNSRFNLHGHPIVTIDGLFHFDFTTKILAWRRLEDLKAELPLSLEIE